MSQSRHTASALLNCLEQLHGDVWAEVLLPKLRADKSAGNLALTCSCLRDICHKSQRQLDLSSISTSSSTSSSAVDAALGTLAQHFPNCTLVKVELEKYSSYLFIPAIVDALARLSSLTGVSLSVRDQSQPLALAVTLGTITRQLPQLSTLSLHTTHNWTQVVWDQLGTATQLTFLSIDCAAGSGVAGKYSLQNFAALRGLTGLQHLVFSYRRPTQQEQQEQQQEQEDEGQPGLDVLLGALTALTRLQLPVMTTQGLSSISSCTALKVLSLRSAAPQLQLAGSDLGAIGQLTQLTYLHISKKLQDQDPQQQSAFYSALGKLVCLSKVFAGFWTPAVVPVLAALPKLEYIKGAWQEGGRCFGGKLHRSDVPIWSVGRGAICCLSQPGDCQTMRAINAASWLSLGGSCPKLRGIFTDWDHNKQPDWNSFQPGADTAARVAAIQGWSALTCLTDVTFHVSNKFEIAALVEAVPQVQHLQILGGGLPRGCGVSLLLVGRLSCLRSLVVAVWAHYVGLDAESFPLLLAAVSHVPKVYLACPRGNHATCQTAAHRSSGTGIKLPPSLTIRPLGS